jgi:hypothetical protein
VLAFTTSRQGWLWKGSGQPYILPMVTFQADVCAKCKGRNPVGFTVTPEEAFRAVVLNRWRIICPACFDAEAEKAGIRYSFGRLDGVSWSDRPAPSSRRSRKR